MSLPYPLVFSTLGTPDWSLERAIAQAVADGYAGLEVRILDGQVIPPDLPKARRGEIRRLLQQHERIIAGIGASTRFSSPDPDERAKHLADLQSYLALANDCTHCTNVRRQPDRQPNHAGSDRPRGQ